MGSLSIGHWLIVLVIVLVIFGTRKLRNIGQDLGAGVKGFKDGLREGTEDKDKPTETPPPHVGHTIEGEVKKDKS